jgi:putative hemolysin
LSVELLIIIVLVLLNGFFSMSEMALISAKRARLQAAADQGSRGAKTALALLSDPTGFLSAVQIGITLIGILTGVYSGATLAQHLAARLIELGAPLRYAEEVSFTAIVVLVTFLSLILGELVPKRIALNNAERLAAYVAPIMKGFAWLMTPLVWLLRGVVELILRILPISAASQASVTEDEVRSLIAEATQRGVFLTTEKRLIEGVLALADRKVESIMVPRQDVVWLDLDDPLPQLWQQAKESGHARFLVGRGALDNLLGMITLANLSEALRRGVLNPDTDIEPALHVPEGITILQLLSQFQTSSNHLAIVTDEYGDIQGIATPVDVLRAIVGELPEVGSREHPELVQRDDGSWLADGHLAIDELQTHLGRRDMAGSGDYHTVAGFVLARLGRIPKAGDTLTWRDLRIEVMDMDGRRIDKLLVSRLDAKPLPEMSR